MKIINEDTFGSGPYPDVTIFIYLFLDVNLRSREVHLGDSYVHHL